MNRYPPPVSSSGSATHIYMTNQNQVIVPENNPAMLAKMLVKSLTNTWVKKLNEPIQITPLHITLAIAIVPLAIAAVTDMAVNETTHKIERFKTEICTIPTAPPAPTVEEQPVVDAPEEITEESPVVKPEKKKKESKKVPQHTNTVFDVPSSGNSEVDAFVRRFAHVAVAEMQKFGIPASVTLAQGILESRYGTSPLAKEANNFFGVKGKGGPKKHDDCCKSKRCKKPDGFRQYASAWESFRHHSQVLMADRYQKRIKGSKSPKVWAKALKAGGYARDPHYVQKIMSTIAKYNLTRYDKENSKYTLVATN